MPTKTFLLSAAVLLVSSLSAHADVIAGPITNPANGHDYYLLSPNSWNAAEQEAENLGGTLAIIKSATEQEWIFTTFGALKGSDHALWIGLRRGKKNHKFGWVTAAKLAYTNWSWGNPDNHGGKENHVQLYPTGAPDRPGTWNDATDNSYLNGLQPYGIAELQGKLENKALTEGEKSLAGTWYEIGHGDRACAIASTDKILFAIGPRHYATRLIPTTEGVFFAVDWQKHLEVIKDRILWSDGQWWSRQPVEYK